jgi:hypothetical protein
MGYLLLVVAGKPALIPDMGRSLIVKIHIAKIHAILTGSCSF